MPSPAPTSFTSVPTEHVCANACAGHGECFETRNRTHVCVCAFGWEGDECETATPKELDEKRMIQIDISYGVSRTGAVSTTFPSGIPKFNDFDITDEDTQLYIVETCRLARNDSSLSTRSMGTVCVLDYFDSQWLAPQGLRLPLPAENFSAHFWDFYSSEPPINGNKADMSEWFQATQT